MSIETQKKIKFIPILHMIVIPMWLRTYYKYPSTYTRFMSKVFLIFGIVFLTSIPAIIIHRLNSPEWIYDIIMRLISYIQFLSIAEISIRDQEYIISEAEKR